ncbi:hydrogenase maturation protease [Nitrosomonas sp.]|uniref:hydrogenase maturation protease n=1 Tax=Nitrosomonas sp. TaxID=42353 RepID=UPI001D4503FC|nr:hydrogenase maturation protease [Nitrosomonas sp.]MBX3616794.1 hydrogenase maturation protease [Nitrosomonas sp.]
MQKLLFFGYGNPSRGDDALGPLLIEHIHQLSLTGLSSLVEMQLMIEHVTDLIGYDRIVFVDADMMCKEPFEFSEVSAKKDDSYTSHALTPATLLYTFQNIYRQPPPPSFLLRIRGYSFELEDRLSKQADMNMQAALAAIRQWFYINENIRSPGCADSKNGCLRPFTGL